MFNKKRISCSNNRRSYAITMLYSSILIVYSLGRSLTSSPFFSSKRNPHPVSAALNITITKNQPWKTNGKTAVGSTTGTHVYVSFTVLIVDHPSNTGAPYG